MECRLIKTIFFPKSDPEDVSYASLDLRLVQKHKKKKRYQEKQNQTHKVQTHPPPMTQMRRMEMGADCDVALPSRSSSLIVSRSSIYLNSHQVALETEELQRERERERERQTEWQSNQERDDDEMAWQRWSQSGPSRPKSWSKKPKTKANIKSPLVQNDLSYI